MVGKHRKQPKADKQTREFHDALRSLPTYDGKRMVSNADAVCKHAETVVLAGRIVCNSGCGADLGPANG